MRNNFIIILLLLAGNLSVAAQQPQPVVNVSYYYKKLKSSEGTYIGDQKTGEWYYWGTNGYLEKRENYTAGVPDGRYESFYNTNSPGGLIKPARKKYKEYLYNQKTGTVQFCKESGYYNRGLKDHTWLYYNYGNRLYKKATYSNDTLNGEYEEYLANGKLLIRCQYKNGLLHGPYEKYEDGIKTSWGQYFYGEKRGLWYHRSGNILLEEYYQSPIRIVN